MENEEYDWMNKYDSAIAPTYITTTPNEQIIIYSGQFELKSNENSYYVSGDIIFKWLPHPDIFFKGTIDKYVSQNNIETTLRNNLYREEKIELNLNNSLFGVFYITNIEFPSLDIAGTILSGGITGKEEPVNHIQFSIVNFDIDYIGEITKVGKNKLSKNRLRLNCDEYEITIDKLQPYSEMHDLLYSDGGYMVLHGGLIRKKTGNISFEEYKKITHSLSVFLTFANGRQCDICFVQGYQNNNHIWTDYNSPNAYPYKYVFSWPRKHSIEGLNELWINFRKIWENEDDRAFLETAITWYTEANCVSGYAEGSIMMAQTALELIYNWLIVEKKKLLFGKDASGISASNKIRLVLSHIQCTSETPIALSNLISFINTDNQIIDGPEAFVQIRNMIVHSQESKRKKLSSIDKYVMTQVLRLGVWYIELALLNILKYNGYYRNRCNKGVTEQLPWKNK